MRLYYRFIFDDRIYVPEDLRQMIEEMIKNI